MKKRGFVNSILSKMKKRGLSTVVISLIIILISLVAVGIIWVVVRNVIQTGTKEVTLGQFTLDAKIKDVNVYNLSNNVSLTVKRNPGVGEFSRMNFVFYDGKSSEVVTQPVSLNELEEKWFMFHLGTIDVDNLISISIFPYVKQDEKEILGNILDKYTVSSGSSIILPVCAPATCASLGYECGTNWANGTNCAGALNCEPPNCITRYGAGYTCNSSGRCFFGTCTPLINNYCSVQGYECGYWGNNTCSGNLSCGTCGTGNCNASGKCVVTNCNTSSLTWQNNFITSQNGWFTAVFNITPSDNNLDGVFGLSQGVQSTYSGFSALLRLNTSGYLEMFDGDFSVYRALQLVSYTTNNKYNFRFVVNITSQRYNVYVTPQGGIETLLASNFGFRTSATLINNFGLISSSGTFSVCNFNIVSSTPAPSCAPAVCGTPGYMCGTRNNGTCPGTLSCGTCGTGYDCVGGSCVLNTGVFCGPSRTYYIDYENGNDNNNGTCSNSAWKRHPYMNGFIGSYTHLAGDRFIFKGGVTWLNSNFPLTVAAGGSAAAGNDYYGVDTRWYSGGLWTKPVFDGQYISPILINLYNDRSYITFDNLELKRISTSNSAYDGLITGGWANSNLLFKNLYLHGWRTTNAVDNAHGGLLLWYGGGNSVTNPIVNVVLENSVIENSENTGIKQGGVAIRQVQTIRNCSIHDVSSAVLFTADFHDNELYNVYYPSGNVGFDVTYHTNGVYLDGGYLAVNGTLVGYAYNNKVHDVGTNAIYPNPAEEVQYIWNNIIYGVQSGQGAIEIDPYDYGGSNGGSVYVWSNTIVNYNINLPAILIVGRPEVKLTSLVAQNNHVIGGNSVTNADSGNTLSITTDHNLWQTSSVATGQGYTLANLYAPINSTVPTVNNGTSLSFYFTKDIKGVSRPQGSAWDIGAYEYV